MLKSFQHLKGTLTLFRAPASQTSKLIEKRLTEAKPKFSVDVTDKAPTKEQSAAILDYLKSNDKEILKSRPILVDWDNGKIAIDDLEKSNKIIDEKKE